MPRGGHRPGAGRPRKHPKPAPEVQKESAQSLPLQVSATTQPLDYMLAVMRDANSDPEMRARMAVAAAPYVHPKMGEQGKKEQKNEAARKLASRFGARPAPVSTAH